MLDVSRRRLIIGTAGVIGASALGSLAGCSAAGRAVGPMSDPVRQVDAARRAAGQKVVAARLTARETTIDLAGTPASTWGYNDSVPGPLLRAQAGDLLRVQVDNRLLVDTSVHWHGLALRNDMDGVPGITQDPIVSGATYTYEFTAPHPGTYFYHHIRGCSWTGDCTGR
jgi:FtsP/CotA-like multicopper oxidase with cupredoxin domain